MNYKQKNIRNRIIFSTVCLLLGYLILSFINWDILWISNIAKFSEADRIFLMIAILLGLVSGPICYE